jgi:O-antigen/teichoic acid export membrane protein
MLDSRAEIIILSLFFNEAIVGYYTAVNTIIGGLTLFSEAIRNAIFPVILRYQQEPSEKIKELVFLLGKYILIITIPISVLVFFLSDEIISFFFGVNFDLSVAMLRITIWSFISYSLTVVLSVLLMAYDKEKKVAISLFISGTITILLNLLLAPLIGPIGIALVRVITSFVMFLICLHFHFMETGYGIIDGITGVKILFVWIVMFFSIQLLTEINKWFAIFTGVSFFVIFLFISKVIVPKDISLWRNVTKELFPRK